MLVLYDNQMWNLDMPYLLFESFKRSLSNKLVTLEEATQSSYKRQVTVPITKVEDYSIARNENALRN